MTNERDTVKVEKDEIIQDIERQDEFLASNNQLIDKMKRKLDGAKSNLCRKNLLFQQNQSQLVNLNQVVVQLTNELDDLKRELQNFQQESVNKQNTINNLTNQRSVLQLEIVSLHTKLRQSQEDLTNYTDFINHIKDISGITNLDNLTRVLNNLIDAHNEIDSEKSLTKLLGGKMGDNHLQSLLNSQANLTDNQKKLSSLNNELAEAIIDNEKVSERSKEEKNAHESTKIAKEKVENDLLTKQEKINNLTKEISEKEQQIVEKIVNSLKLEPKENSSIEEIIITIKKLITSPNNSSERENKYDQFTNDFPMTTKENLPILAYHYQELTRNKIEQDKKILNLQSENNQLILTNETKKTYVIVMLLITLLATTVAFGLKMKKLRNKKSA